MRPRCEVGLNNRGLIVGARNEPDLRVEVFLSDSMTRIKIEPVVGVGNPASESCVIAREPLGKRFGIVSTQIEISEQHKLRVGPKRAVVRVERISVFLVS